MKKNNYIKTHNLYKIIFIFIVFLGIGYAFLDATLNIDGDTTVTAPELNVYVQSINVTAGSTSASTGGDPVIIGNAKKEVNFSTALTNDGNSFFEETSTLVNKGTGTPYLLGVDVKVYDSNNNEVTLSAPYEYSITNGDGTPLQVGTQLAVNSTASFKFKFNYVTGTDMTTITDYPIYTFKITYNYVVNKVVLPSGKSKDNLTFGDEICILDQCFNFIKYDNNDVVMLAKWNLKVGNIYNSSATKTGEYTSSDTGYGLQSSEARGYVDGETRYGTVAFSDTNYWDDNGSPKSDYPGSYYPGPNYPTIYDAINYKGAPGTATYSVAYYVIQYRNKLISDYHVGIKNARLLTYAEATDSSIGCDGTSNYSCPTNGFITNTSFWLGSASRSSRVWNADSNGGFGYDMDYNFDDSFGVRPVVVISKANM